MNTNTATATTTVADITTGHVGHRNHLDATGTGDRHCSDHRQADCFCTIWSAAGVPSYPKSDMADWGTTIDPEQDRYA